jgi:predicted nucleic-acid-binding protein
MIAADTNLWARAYLDDDTVQSGKARAAIKAACETDGIFVPLLVLAELAWVLRGRWQRERVLDTLGEIFTTDGIVVESRALAERALAAARAGAVGFADLLIAEVSFAGGASAVLTFDKAFGKQPRVRRMS